MFSSSLQPPSATLGQIPDSEPSPPGFLFLQAATCQCLQRLSDSDPVLPSASGDLEAWQKGVLFASGQNLARQLMETPANEMTPTKFAEIIEKNLKSASSKTEVHIR